MLQEIEWRGFQGYEFEFEGLPAKLIKPNCEPNGKWLLKAEYFDAFPETEIELLNRGLPIDMFIKEGADHHPHGLENPCIVADIIETF